MQLYTESLTAYKRLKTREVKIGDLLLGNGHPIRIQTMTTTDTMDTMATVEQSIRCIEAGAELVRITAPSKKEAENLQNIKDELRRRGYNTPLVADIHFTPNAAEIAARIVEKVRVNPGNYVDKKKFEQIEYTDAEYIEEIERIRERFTPLVKICKEHGTAMRIGTNHGSLSDRIMSRYGDTPIGMVESAMEFLRIARSENYHNIILSMKASNPQVMVQAYRLLINKMHEEFGECYPLHLGVTEAGDGEDGRIKSAIGIGTLLEDGIGDTIRVSLTEDPELELPVCRDIAKRYADSGTEPKDNGIKASEFSIGFNPFHYNRRQSFVIDNIGGHHVPVVIADLSKLKNINHDSLETVGYKYDQVTDKWHIADTAADYIYTGKSVLDFDLPGTLKVIIDGIEWEKVAINSGTPHKDWATKYFPIYEAEQFALANQKHAAVNFVMVDCMGSDLSLEDIEKLQALAEDRTVILCLLSTNKNSMQSVRAMFTELGKHFIKNPVILITDSNWKTPDEHLIHFATETGALLLDGMGDGICLGMNGTSYNLLSDSYNQNRESVSGRSYLKNQSVEEFINNTAFIILQATRTRISKTEYISCPSCGRTLFDLK